MPDVSISGIEFEIKGSADAATQSIAGLTKGLKDLNSTLKQTKSLSKLSVQMGQIGTAAKASSKHTNQFFSSIARIAKYRMIRSALKAVTQAFSEGLKNAYQFSKINGGQLAKSMDTLATKSLTMKNQLGAAFGGLLTAIAPVVETIIRLVTRLANALSMLFAAFSGQTQYKEAVDAWTEWGEAAAGAGGAAQKALEYLAPFDELNVLPDDKSGGGGGGSTPNANDMFDYADLPEWMQKISEFASSLKITFNDVFIDWSDLTGEQIAEKVIAGLGLIVGAGVGFLIGGVPGAVVGSLVGVAISLGISSLIFDHDGVISKGELSSLIRMALFGICGGIVGFINGGPVGAFIGMTVGLGISGIIQAIKFTEGNVESETPILDMLVESLPVIGGVLGLMVGGPGGAALGALIGLGITLHVSTIEFGEGEDNKQTMTATQFLHDVIGLPYDQEIVDWVSQGINDIVNETVRFITGGSSAEDIVHAIETQWPLVEAWFQDLPAQFKNLGIRAMNGLKQGIENGINAVIDAINSSGIADFFGIHLEPIHFELTPEIPEDELHANYNAAKAALELDGADNPPQIPIEIAPPNENGATFTLTVDTTANFTDWSVKGTKDDTVVKKWTTWSSTANWNDWKVYGTKNTNQNGWSTWNSTANFTKKNLDTSQGLKTDGTNLKLDATANITKIVGQTTAVINEAGGVYNHGSWRSIPQYAGGTANAHGSLFVAGEAGPEVVGHIGGRTEVLNRSQLAATMYSAVVGALSSLKLTVTAPTATNPAGTGDNEEAMYRAFRRALDETDFDKDIELDGQKLYSAMVRRNRQNTRMTGVNAFA